MFQKMFLKFNVFKDTLYIINTFEPTKLKVK